MVALSAGRVTSHIVELVSTLQSPVPSSLTSPSLSYHIQTGDSWQQTPEILNSVPFVVDCNWRSNMKWNNPSICLLRISTRREKEHLSCLLTLVETLNGNENNTRLFCSSSAAISRVPGISEIRIAGQGWVPENKIFVLTSFVNRMLSDDTRKLSQVLTSLSSSAP